MLVGLWGFISRLEEKLVYGEKESRWAVLSWNCDEMLVYGLQHTAQPSLGIMPTSLLVSSSIWTTTSPQTLPQASTTHPKIRLLPSSPNSPMSFPSCNRSPGWILYPVAGVHGCGGTLPPIFPGNCPDLYAKPCSELCQPLASWLSIHAPVWYSRRPVWTQVCRSDFSVTQSSVVWKSPQKWPHFHSSPLTFLFSLFTCDSQLFLII